MFLSLSRLRILQAKGGSRITLLSFVIFTLLFRVKPLFRAVKTLLRHSALNKKRSSFIQISNSIIFRTNGNWSYRVTIDQSSLCVLKVITLIKSGFILVSLLSS